MKRFRSGDVVVVTPVASPGLVGKVAVLEHVSPRPFPGTVSYLVRFLQPIENGQRCMMFSEDELARLSETKLDKIPDHLMP